MGDGEHREAPLLSRESSEFLQGIVDAIADPVFVKDEQHRWVLLNDAMCRFFGVPREALIGLSDFDFFPEEEARVFREKDALVFSTGEENINEERFTDANGVRHVISTKKTIFECDGARYLVGVIRDITEIKHAQAELESQRMELLEAKDRAVAAARSKDEFLANTSHELRTPMNAVVGMVDLLMETELDEQQNGYVELIREGARHLAMLIDDILDLTRADAGKLRLNRREFELHDTLSRAGELFRQHASRDGLTLEIDLHDALPQKLIGDERRLRQIVVNLMSNAIKFTERGTVRLAARGRALENRRYELCVEVSDSGIGIAPDRLSGIFGRFEQVDGSPTRQRGGLGLGLAISRGLVRAMGGVMSVTSRVGAGSTFTVRLPLDVARGDTARATASDDEGTATTHPMRLMVAEDNVVNQQVMRAMLKRLGYTATHVRDGADALAAFVDRGEHYDVVLMDMHMPQMDGLEATRRLRATLPAERQPVIIGVTASALPGDRDACLEAGMNGFLPKPVRPASLRKVLVEAWHRNEPAAAATAAELLASGAAQGPPDAPAVDDEEPATPQASNQSAQELR